MEEYAKRQGQDPANALDDALASYLERQDKAGRPATDIAALDWSQCRAVESVPGKVSGAWVFKGTRMPVSAVFENLEDGVTIDELVQLYDGLTRARRPRLPIFFRSIPSGQRNKWRLVQRMIRKTVAAVNTATPASYAVIEIPDS